MSELTEDGPGAETPARPSSEPKRLRWWDFPPPLRMIEAAKRNRDELVTEHVRHIANLDEAIRVAELEAADIEALQRELQGYERFGRWDRADQVRAAIDDRHRSIAALFGLAVADMARHASVESHP